MSIQNFDDAASDPFADVSNTDNDGPLDAKVNEGLIHIRIQQRNGRKTLTTIQGLPNDFDKKKIVRACKKEFACNGTIVEHSEHGKVIQFQGDQRNNIADFLTRFNIVKKTQLKVHGF